MGVFRTHPAIWAGKKGSLYRDLLHAVAEAKRISDPEFCGFFWKQGAADGTKKILAYEYYDTFKQLVSDLRKDLDDPDLPVFLPTYMNDEDLLKAALSTIGDTALQKVRKPAGKTLVKKDEQLESLLKYLHEASWTELTKSGSRRPYMAAVAAAQNRAGREIPNVTTIYPGKVPTGADGVHFSSDG